MKKNKKTKENLVGRKFGRLTVIEDDGTRTKCGSIKYLCKCECGNFKHVRGSHLKIGKTKSCGCLHKTFLEEQTTKNISEFIGKRFSRLVVIEDSGKRESGHIVYICDCDCGNRTKASRKSLTSGGIRSCGCLRNEIARKTCEENNFKIIEKTNLTLIASKKLNRNNTSGVKGVFWDKRRGKWEAFINFKGKKYYCGSFDKKVDAINARKEAEEKYFEPILEKYK